VKREQASLARTALLLVAMLPFLYPFVFLVATALKPLSEFNEDAVGLPSSPTLANLRAAWSEASLGPAMLHSLVAVGVAVVATMALSAGGAYWFTRHRGRLSATLRWVLIGTMAIPPPVFIVPLFVELSDWGFTDNLFMLGVVYAAWNAPFGLYLMYAFFEGLPAEVLEAAQVDGANSVQALTRVLLPLSKPALATLAVLTFIWSWSDLLISVVLVQDPSRRLLTPATALLSDQFSTNVPKNTAAVLIAILPLLAVFLLGQRSLVRGILAGVGK
jgi:ABC-type glycerol-3-phosphate transport system permease component